MREEMESIRKQLEKEANEEVKRQQNMLKTAKAEHQKKIIESIPQLLVKWKADDESDYTECDLRKLFSNVSVICRYQTLIHVFSVWPNSSHISNNIQKRKEKSHYRV